jgi:hypothetical protein
MKSEVSECTKACKAQGKEYESCRVSQTYRIIRLVNGPEWVDGPLSCSCKEPNNFQCPKVNPNTVKVLTWGTAGAGLVYIITEYWWVPALFY